MLPFIVIFCCLYLALGATDTDLYDNTGNDGNGLSKRDLLSEITSLRQLVNQESLYRQELERQVREFRQQMLNGNTPMTAGIESETWNTSCSWNFNSVMIALEKMAQSFNARMTNFEKKLTQNQDLIFEMFTNLSLTVHEKQSLNYQNMHEKQSLNYQNMHEKQFLKTKDSYQTGNENKTELGDGLNLTPTVKVRNITRTYGKGHMGKSFAVMVPPGLSNRNMPISLIISCEFSTQITLRSSYPGVSKVFNVTPPGTNLTLPADFALRQSGGTIVQSRGVILESSEYVSVYVFNEDGYVALPARYLGTHYKSLTTDHGDSFIAIMPYGGCARISIKSTKGVADQTIYIPELSVYFLWRSSKFENVMISSNRTIAVISGHVKSFSSKKQIVYDSILPINYWNTTYIIPYIQNTTSKYDFFYSTASRRIFAMRNFKTTETTIALPYTFFSSKNTVSNYIQAKQGSLSVVLWYYKGTVFNSFMCTVPSLAQFSNNYHFWTPFYTDNNFLAAIIKEEDSDGLRVDNSPVTNPYMSHSVCTLDKVTYRVLTIAVTNGWHIVKHNDPDVQFGLIMYGGDLNVAYGLPLGLKLD